MPIEPATQSSIDTAAKILVEGGVVAFPTETVYGLGADATNSQAVLRVYEMKGRPRFNPLIAHVADIETAESHGEFNTMARKLAEAFWPGPLTLILKKRPESGICDLVSAGLENVGLRVPANEIARNLLLKAGCPVAAPSANKAGHVSPTAAAHVMTDLGEGPDIILDGGDTALGLESTVVDVSGQKPLLLRPGGLPREKIEQVLGVKLGEAAPGDQPTSPGQLASHYAPRARLRLDATSLAPGEALLAFGPNPLKLENSMVNLSPKGDIREAAARLFSALRELDASGCKVIAVMAIPDAGLGEAINDRLRRAAAPRGEKGSELNQ
jgi:L-threonylcarbamoyladenylate synthase